MTAISSARVRARQFVKGAYHATRNLPDRVLHTRRHLAVRQLLSTLQPPRKILVICYGNVCRSPYLMAVLQRALPNVSVLSAGFVGADRPVPQLSLIISADRGLDLSTYRSRPLSQSAFENTDLVIVMDSDQARQITRMFPMSRARIVVAGDLDPHFDESRAILDPWNRSSDVFELSFDRLDRCAATLVSTIRSGN